MSDAAAAQSSHEPAGAAADREALATPEATSARTRLLVEALERSAKGAAAERFGSVLRRWADEGRPYRGHVFQPQEVEAAISIVAAKNRAKAANNSQVAPAKTSTKASTDSSSSLEVALPTQTVVSSRTPAPARSREHRSSRATSDWSDILGGAISRVEVRAKKWPPPQVYAAAAEVAGLLGPMPSTAVQGSGGLELLKGLFSLAVKSRRIPGDTPHLYTQIDTLDQVAILAHRAVLTAASEMLACRFGSEFGDSACIRVDATDFGAEVVHAAVKFAYLGECRVRGGGLGALFLLADRWQFSALAEAVERCWDAVPAVCCLQILAELEAGTPVPANMLSSVVRVITDTFKKAAEVLESAAGAAQGSLAAAPGSAPAAEPPVVASPAQIATSWRFVREIHSALAEMPPEMAARLSQWVLRDEGLGEAAANFCVSALRAIRTAGPEDPKQLCARHLKSWLPPDIIYCVAERMCVAAGLTDEVGHPMPWVRWTHTGCPSFSVLWRLYEILREYHERQLSALAEPAAGADPALGLSAQAKPALQEFPRTLDAGFAAALVDELHRDGAAAQQWEELVLGPATPVRAAAEESLHLLARLLGHRRCLPGGLSPRGVCGVLTTALAGAPPSAVRIIGPGRLAGVFERRGGSRIFFVRSGDERPAEQLVLQRVVRARGRSICVSWRGIPIDVLQSARAEWKIQAAGDDAEVDTPLALALDETEDPSKISARWWVLGSDSVFRQTGPGLVVAPESVSTTVLSPCVDSVLDWAGKGGSLQALEEAADGRMASVSDPLVKQVCKAAHAAFHVSSLGPGSSSSSGGGLKRSLTSEDGEGCRKVARQAETTAASEGSQASRGEREEERSSQDPGAPVLPTLDERTSQGPGSPGATRAAAQASSPARESPERLGSGPHTPPPRTPRWRAAPSPPCWPRSAGGAAGIGAASPQTAAGAASGATACTPQPAASAPPGAAARSPQPAAVADPGAATAAAGVAAACAPPQPASAAAGAAACTPQLAANAAPQASACGQPAAAAADARVRMPAARAGACGQPPAEAGAAAAPGMPPVKSAKCERPVPAAGPAVVPSETVPAVEPPAAAAFAASACTPPAEPAGAATGAKSAQPEQLSLPEMVERGAVMALATMEEAKAGDDEGEDPRWREASRIVDETSAKVQAIMARARTAPRKEKQALLAQKRLLESRQEYVDALRLLEEDDEEAEERPSTVDPGACCASACASAMA